MRTEESMSPRFADLDAWPSLEAVHAMFEGQLSAVAAVRAALPGHRASGRGRRRSASPKADASSMPARERRAESASRTAPSCRRPSTGRKNGSSSRLPAASGRCARAPKAPRTIATRRSAPLHGLRDRRARRRDRIGGQRRDALYGRIRSRRARPRSAHGRRRQQSGRPAPFVGRAPHLDRHGAGGFGRVHSDESGHGAEGRAQPFLHPGDDPPRARLSRIDGGHARQQRQAFAAGGGHGQPSCALRRANRGERRSKPRTAMVKVAVLLARESTPKRRGR